MASAIPGPSAPISRPRKLAAALAMGAASAVFLHEAFFWQADVVAYTSLLAAAGIGLGRRSLPVQVVSRGVAWTMFLAMLVAVGVAALGGRLPRLETVALLLLTGSALLLARPMLHTADARREFAPKMFRRWFLAGSTASAATGIVAAGVALASFIQGSVAALPFAAVSLSLLASAVAVVRMRTWGILLGWATSVALLVTAAWVGGTPGIALALAAAPPLLLHLLPVLVARTRTPPADMATTSQARLASVDMEGSDALEPARLRVVGEPAVHAELDAAALDPAPPPHAGAAALRA